MIVDDVRTGMILNWQSEHYPEKKSRWIVLEQLRETHVEGRRFKIYCLQSSDKQSTIVGDTTTYTFHRGNIHRFTVHSQI
jgi:hypothetical protein